VSESPPPGLPPGLPPGPPSCKPRGPPLYLASQSPRRQQLLRQIGIEPVLLLAGADEDAESLELALPRELPAAYVQRVTALKLRAAVARHGRRGLAPGAILAADTTVALGRRILGKPADAADAAATLAALSGRTHRVLTAVAVQAGRRRWQALQVSRVRFGVLPPAVIDAYVAGGEAFGKAGAYAIQGTLAGWVSHIAGSHSGIVGLPLYETAQLLKRAGVETKP
jgi:septum formation protein